eukprot:Rmarinus@m.14141
MRFPKVLHILLIIPILSAAVDPALYYRFDKGGLIVTDATGSYPGVNSGASFESTDCHQGGCFAFDAYSYVDVPVQALSPIPEEITVAAWLFGDTSVMLPVNSRNVVFSAVGAEESFVASAPDDDYTASLVTGAEELRQSIDGPDRIAGQWHHWAFTKNVSSGWMRIYCDGDLYTESSGHTQAILPFSEVRVGNSGIGGEGYLGRMDELLVFTEELSAEQVLWLMEENECSLGMHTCTGVSVCVDLASDNGHYDCLCPSDYWGDGRYGTCAECAENANAPAGSLYAANCTCNDGYSGVGASYCNEDAADVDECCSDCDDMSHDCFCEPQHNCLGDAQCVNTPGSFYCYCENGYVNETACLPCQSCLICESLPLTLSVTPTATASATAVESVDNPTVYMDVSEGLQFELLVDDICNTSYPTIDVVSLDWDVRWYSVEDVYLEIEAATLYTGRYEATAQIDVEETTGSERREVVQLLYLNECLYSAFLSGSSLIDGKLYISQELAFEITFESDCNASPNLQWNWASSLPNPPPEFVKSMAKADSSLIVPAYTFSEEEFSIYVDVCVGSTPDCEYLYLDVVVEATPLQAKLKGGLFRGQSLAHPLTIDGTGSYDPDVPSSVDHLDATISCAFENGTACFAPIDDLFVELAPGVLGEGVYTFSFVLQDPASNRNSSEETVVRVMSQDNVPLVVLDAFSVTRTYSSVVLDIPVTIYSNVDDTLIVTWNATCDTCTVKELNLTDPAVAVLLDDYSLKVSENILEPGQYYSFTIDVIAIPAIVPDFAFAHTNAGEETSHRNSILNSGSGVTSGTAHGTAKETSKSDLPARFMSTGPAASSRSVGTRRSAESASTAYATIGVEVSNTTSGSCRISPASGSAFEGFTIEAYGWVSSYPPLQYAFSYQKYESNTISPIVDYQYSSEVVNISLPAPGSTEGDLLVYCFARDASGVEIPPATTTVTVTWGDLPEDDENDIPGCESAITEYCSDHLDYITVHEADAGLVDNYWASCNSLFLLLEAYFVSNSLPVVCEDRFVLRQRLAEELGWLYRNSIDDISATWSHQITESASFAARSPHELNDIAKEEVVSVLFDMQGIIYAPLYEEGKEWFPLEAATSTLDALSSLNKASANYSSDDFGDIHALATQSAWFSVATSTIGDDQVIVKGETIRTSSRRDFGANSTLDPFTDGQSNKLVLPHTSAFLDNDTSLETQFVVYDFDSFSVSGPTAVTSVASVTVRSSQDTAMEFHNFTAPVFLTMSILVENMAQLASLNESLACASLAGGLWDTSTAVTLPNPYPESVKVTWRQNDTSSLPLADLWEISNLGDYNCIDVHPLPVWDDGVPFRRFVTSDAIWGTCELIDEGRSCYWNETLQVFQGYGCVYEETVECAAFHLSEFSAITKKPHVYVPSIDDLSSLQDIDKAFIPGLVALLLGVVMMCLILASKWANIKNKRMQTSVLLAKGKFEKNTMIWRFDEETDKIISVSLSDLAPALPVPIDEESELEVEENWYSWREQVGTALVLAYSKVYHVQTSTWLLHVARSYCERLPILQQDRFMLMVLYMQVLLWQYAYQRTPIEWALRVPLWRLFFFQRQDGSWHSLRPLLQTALYSVGICGGDVGYWKQSSKNSKETMKHPAFESIEMPQGLRSKKNAEHIWATAVSYVFCRRSPTYLFVPVEDALSPEEKEKIPHDDVYQYGARSLLPMQRKAKRFLRFTAGLSETELRTVLQEAETAWDKWATRTMEIHRKLLEGDSKRGPFLSIARFSRIGKIIRHYPWDPVSRAERIAMLFTLWTGLMFIALIFYYSHVRFCCLEMKREFGYPEEINTESTADNPSCGALFEETAYECKSGFPNGSQASAIGIGLFSFLLMFPLKHALPLLFSYVGAAGLNKSRFKSRTLLDRLIARVRRFPRRCSLLVSTLIGVLLRKLSPRSGTNDMKSNLLGDAPSTGDGIELSRKEKFQQKSSGRSMGYPKERMSSSKKKPEVSQTGIRLMRHTATAKVFRHGAFVCVLLIYFLFTFLITWYGTLLYQLEDPSRSNQFTIAFMHSVFFDIVFSLISDFFIACSHSALVFILPGIMVNAVDWVKETVNPIQDTNDDENGNVDPDFDEFEYDDERDGEYDPAETASGEVII